MISVAEAYSCKAEISWRTPHYIPVVNDPIRVAEVETIAKNLVGDNQWVTLEAPSMGGEDFGFLASKIPLHLVS